MVSVSLEKTMSNFGTVDFSVAVQTECDSRVVDGDEHPPSGVDPCLVEGRLDHHYPLARGEGVVPLVAPLRAPDDDVEVVDVLEGVLHRGKVSVVEWLKPPHKESHPFLGHLFQPSFVDYLSGFRGGASLAVTSWSHGLTVLEIDGSFGEGGGQTIRIATSFSVILNRPIRVTNVRAGRRVPGLRPQHAATLEILREVCGGTLEGGGIGSTEFTFTPGRPENRSLTVDMGTAASITLVLQALVPAISLSGVVPRAGARSGAPTSRGARPPTTSQRCSRRASSRLGSSSRSRSSRRGYYPSGGGRVRVRIEPCREVCPGDLDARPSDPPISDRQQGRDAAEAGRRSSRSSSAVSQLARHGLSCRSVDVRHRGVTLAREFHPRQRRRRFVLHRGGLDQAPAGSPPSGSGQRRRGGSRRPTTPGPASTHTWPTCSRRSSASRRARPPS